MFRQIPQLNKICSAQENQQNHLILVNHIQSMRPQVDNRPPKKYEFLKNNKIKEAYKQEKQFVIERENKNLITKITQIMQQQPPQQSFSLMKRSESTNSGQRLKKSLNKEHRKKELIKIVMENQQLLKRIQDQKSSYNVKSWEEQRKGVEKYIANICDYPYKDFKPTKTLVQFWGSNSRISESQSLQKRDTKQKLDPIRQNSQKSRLQDQRTDLSTQKINDISNSVENNEQDQNNQLQEDQHIHLKDLLEEPLKTENQQEDQEQKEKSEKLIEQNKSDNNNQNLTDNNDLNVQNQQSSRKQDNQQSQENTENLQQNQNIQTNDNNILIKEENSQGVQTINE